MGDLEDVSSYGPHDNDRDRNPPQCFSPIARGGVEDGGILLLVALEWTGLGALVLRAKFKGLGDANSPSSNVLPSSATARLGIGVNLLSEPREFDRHSGLNKAS
mmetsp:Transcript_7923/g.14928  ORF Transcript_7923/g.14928 Transcript_7923/m.14928 type:complete len:104 (-) Transcript_7923:286-597(-)